VGVFAGADAETVNRTVEAVGLDLVQLSGDEPWDMCDKLSLPVLRAVKVRDGTSAEEIIAALRPGAVPLLDTHAEGALGGTGRPFDWAVASEVASRFPIVLAGGLTPENVGEAVRRVCPWAVDVSSGVETDGAKDMNKMRAFITAVREAGMIQGQKVRVLFVCGGNTCRSPMAAAIARQMLGDQAEVESAGTDPGGRVTSDAVEVLFSQLGIDISGHRPRDVAHLALHAYDVIVAMDSRVQKQLLGRHKAPADRIVSWDVDDPWQKGPEAYRRCLLDVQARVQGLGAQLHRDKPQTASRSMDGPGGGEGPEEQMTAPKRLRGLRDDVERWQAEVAEGEVRGTTLYGIARRASDRFEVLFRDVLRLWLAGHGVDYDHHLKSHVRDKPLDRLTLGEVYECFKLLDGKLAQSYEASGISGGGKPRLGNRDKKMLDRLCELRSLTHNEDRFSENLVGNTAELLSLIAQTLGFALFSGVCQDESGVSP
jgi:phosphoribosylanthranilate isomerase